MLLDAQVYEDLEGRWVDLFNRMKWDIVKSVLKSVAGLQGRKFKVLLSPPFTPKTQPLAPCASSLSHRDPSLWVCWVSRLCFLHSLKGILCG